jgi:hyperosmotically inducible periplasmic protein
MIHVSRWNRLLLSVLAAPVLVGVFSTGCSRASSETEPPRGIGRTIEDAGITASVKLSLAFEPGVSAIGINVDTDRGVVTLRGEVRSEAERQLAAKVAEDAAHVREVVNELRVNG